MARSRTSRRADGGHKATLAERVGIEIRRWREAAAHSTREALAPSIGISVRTLERIESGRSEARLSHLVAMEGQCSGLVKRVFELLSTEPAKPVERRRRR